LEANSVALGPAQGKPVSFSVRARQAWTIARTELRRAFFAKRGLWVYALAILPALIFFGHGVDVKTDHSRLARGGLTDGGLMATAQKGEKLDAVKARLGKPAAERSGTRVRRVRKGGTNGTTTHVIEPAVEARFVRLNITRPAYDGDMVARIYEFEIYGEDGKKNLALGRPATGSVPCSADQGPEKAVNGSVAGGKADSWCADAWPFFLQVDLGAPIAVKRFVVKHASAGGEQERSDTRDFTIQVSPDAKTFRTITASSGAAFVDERTEYRTLVYYDGRRRAQLEFVDGTLDAASISPLLDFEEDRAIFAGIFQFFYLRLAIFFGCLGMFMYLFSGEMSNRTLHYWFLAPAPREVLLAGKYAAGLIASAAIFSGGALLAFAAMVWPHDAVEVQAYWSAGGMSHAFWYAPGREEYLDSEKFQLVERDWNAPGNIKGFLRELNRARRENPALQLYENLRFHHADHDGVLVFSKATPDFRNRILVIININPHGAASSMVHLDLGALGLAPDALYRVEDLLHGTTYEWRGAHNYVSLDPRATFMHLFRVA
jgi:hypothetical protein